MEFGTETNIVIDKLAEVLGSTSGEIVGEYTQAVYARGIGNLVVLLGFVALGVGSFKLAKFAVKRMEEERRRDNFELFGGLAMIGAVVGGITGIVGTLCCAFDAIVYLGAPKAQAIKMLMDQLARIGG